MFAPDAYSLRQFYATPMGEQVAALIESGIHHLWPELHGDALLGVGYTAPYLAGYSDGTIAVAMPAAQGAAYWAPGSGNVVLLAQESQLPFREGSLNRILLVHSVENSEQLPWMMDELWRVLVPGGRVLAVVPNRRGLWSRSPVTPFGHGRPFSMAQLKDLFSAHQFTPTRSASALFLPPTRIGFLSRTAPKVETAGRALHLGIGGVLLLEAEKQIYANIRQPAAVRTYVPISVAQGSPT